MLGLLEFAGLPVVLGVVDVGAVVRVVVVVVVVVRAAEVVGDRVAVVSRAEVAVGVGEVVVGTEVVGGGAWAGPEPSELLVLLAGGGRT